jgi:hypothetical protein
MRRGRHLKPYPTNNTKTWRRKVAGSIPNEVIGFFYWPNPSSHNMALGSIPSALWRRGYTSLPCTSVPSVLWRRGYTSLPCTLLYRRFYDAVDIPPFHVLFCTVGFATPWIYLPSMYSSVPSVLRPRQYLYYITSNGKMTKEYWIGRKWSWLNCMYCSDIC